MFYKDCLLTRKRALSNTQSEEYNKILRVVTRYALHNHTVAFSCKKFGESSTDVQTSGGSAVDTFKTLFGNTLAREILEFSVESTQYEFKAKGFISNPNYNRKKGMFIFFINSKFTQSFSEDLVFLC
jgi:DNA mismatch repair protein MLH1